MARAMQEAQMRQQGFESSQAQAVAQLQAQQGLGTYQTQLGGHKDKLTRSTSSGSRSS